MAIVKCKMCGGNLDLTSDSIFVECVYCGTLQKLSFFEEESHDDFEIVNGKLIKYRGKDEEIYIPSNVTEIGDSAFFFCQQIKKVSVPYGVKTIGNDAFYLCENLTSISISSGVTKIGDRAFSRCKSLVSIEIPNDVVELGEYAFKECSKLEKVTLSNGVKKLQKYTFFDCDSLTDVVLPSNLVTICEYAFKNCKSLIAINIPSSVTDIEDGAFEGCTKLTTIELPENIDTIAKSLFWGCKALTNIVIPSNVDEIEMNAFGKCKRLESITIPESVTEISFLAFCGSEKLTIHASSNSYASKYAWSERIPFIATNNEWEDYDDEVENEYSSKDDSMWGRDEEYEEDFDSDDEFDDMIITLNSDDDTDIKCRIETIFSVGDIDYVALKPYDNDNFVYLYRFAQNFDAEISLTSIEDDEEYELVTETYDRLVEGNDYEDEDEDDYEF